MVVLLIANRCGIFQAQWALHHTDILVLLWKASYLTLVFLITVMVLLVANRLGIFQAQWALDEITQISYAEILTVMVLLVANRWGIFQA